MRRAVVFEAPRDGYAIDQVANGAMTVGELREILDDYDDETLVILSHVRGYTYGSINQQEYLDLSETEDGWDEDEWTAFIKERTGW